MGNWNILEPQDDEKSSLGVGYLSAACGMELHKLQVLHRQSSSGGHGAAITCGVIKKVQTAIGMSDSNMENIYMTNYVYVYYVYVYCVYCVYCVYMYMMYIMYICIFMHVGTVHETQQCGDNMYTV